MVAFEPDDGKSTSAPADVELDTDTVKEMDVRGVSVVWNTETDDTPAISYHGCASEFEALGLLVVGVLTMAMEYAFPVQDQDEEDEDDDTVD